MSAKEKDNKNKKQKKPKLSKQSIALKASHEHIKNLTILVDTYYVAQSPLLDELTKEVNNTYNEVNYLIRQDYIKRWKMIKKDYKLYRRHYLKKKPKWAKAKWNATKLYQKLQEQTAKGENTLYAYFVEHHLAHVMTQTIKMVLNNWQNYYKSLSKYKDHPNKYNGKPRLPGYSKKSTRHTVFLDNEAFGLRDFKHNILSLKNLDTKIQLSPDLIEALDEGDDPNLNFFPRKRRIREIKIIPITFGYKVTITYLASNKKFATYKGKPVPKRNPNIYVGLDPGVDIVAAVSTNNVDFNPLLISGGGFKSVNHFYNKQLAILQAKYAQYQQKSTGYCRKHLTAWRDRKIHDGVHKVTDRILSYAIACGASYIFPGHNKGWKNGTNMGKRNNQNFVGIPHHKLIDMLTYKAARYDIQVIPVNESYTSQTSFLDHEKPVNYYGDAARARRLSKKIGKKVSKNSVARRKKRGLFTSNEGYHIHADVNGSLQIIKKYIKDFDLNTFCNSKGNSVPTKQVIGCVLHPVKWSPHF